MNLILLFSNDFLDGSTRVRLSDRRFLHAKTIHQVKLEDSLQVGLLNGKMGTGIVTKIEDTFMEMDVTLETPPPPPLPVTVILALPRPKVIKRVMIAMTSMGVKKIFLINAYRVEKSFWQSPVLSKESLDLHCLLGLEQAKDTLFPEITLARYFKPFVEDTLPEIIKDTLSIVAHPKANTPCPAHVNGPVTLVIGPEGGFIPYEIEKLISCGVKPVHIGPRILRVETALPFILSRLM
ncbi:MAG: 16S rRNA (uracil(1498)-N(3))-methyltransferase [Proteobacteria bacterium]|nr:16S rRNA (uracil(1498)-N(3))-methyltransferase [Pseudomonadota bacterium]